MQCRQELMESHINRSKGVWSWVFHLSTQVITNCSVCNWIQSYLSFNSKYLNQTLKKKLVFMDLVNNSSLTGCLIIFVSSFVLFFLSFICIHFVKTKCDILGRVKVQISHTKLPSRILYLCSTKSNWIHGHQGDKITTQAEILRKYRGNIGENTQSSQFPL